MFWSPSGHTIDRSDVENCGRNARIIMRGVPCRPGVQSLWLLCVHCANMVDVAAIRGAYKDCGWDSVFANDGALAMLCLREIESCTSWRLTVAECVASIGRDVGHHNKDVGKDKVLAKLAGLGNAVCEAITMAGMDNTEFKDLRKWYTSAARAPACHCNCGGGMGTGCR